MREATEPFVSSLFPRGTTLLRTEPLRVMVIGAFLRSLSMRDVESLCEQAGLGSCRSRPRPGSVPSCASAFAAFQRRDLYEIHLAALFLDATFLAVRPSGPTEGVLVAWGFTEAGERVLLSVMLGMRESHEDWLALGRDLIARGLSAPMLVVADGAPGLIKAIEQCWPASDRQHCAVHRVRNPPRSTQTPSATSSGGAAAIERRRGRERSFGGRAELMEGMGYRFADTPSGRLATIRSDPGAKVVLPSRSATLAEVVTVVWCRLDGSEVDGIAGLAGTNSSACGVSSASAFDGSWSRRTASFGYPLSIGGWTGCH